MSLTELSYYIRKYLPFAILFLLLFLIFFYAVKLFFVYLDLNKPKPLLINPIFNKIRRPVLHNASSSAKLNFTLDTIAGTPVTATDTAKVYFLPPYVVRFGYREKIYLMAKNLGFNTEEVKHQLNEQEKEAVFTDQDQELKIDIANFNFSYSYNFTNNPEIFANAVFPSSKEIENKAINVLTSLDRYPEELSQGKTYLIYLSYDTASGTLVELTDPQTANAVEVDFYRPDLGDYRIVTPKFFNSQNYVVLTFNNDSSYKVLKAQVRFFEKSEEQVGIYPLKKGDQAWQELKSRQASIIYPTPTTGDIKIKEMFLGYFDPDTYQDYLQPVYVFLGSNNFVAYVPAVANEYFGK